MRWSSLLFFLFTHNTKKYISFTCFCYPKEVSDQNHIAVPMRQSSTFVYFLLTFYLSSYNNSGRKQNILYGIMQERIVIVCYLRIEAIHNAFIAILVQYYFTEVIERSPVHLQIIWWYQVRFSGVKNKKKP